MSELELSVNLPNKVKRKYTKTGLHSKKYKAFRAKGKSKKSVHISTDSAQEEEVKPVKWVDTSLAKYHSFEQHDTFVRCNTCGSILRVGTTGCQYCVRKDRNND